MAKVKLSDLMPLPGELDSATIIERRKLLANWLAAYWPELDTRPNSVFGDLSLTPFATLLAAAEVANAREKSDLNPANVALGTIYDEEFVRGYMANFGVLGRSSLGSSGVIQMVFSQNQTYVLDSALTLTINGYAYTFGTDEESPITILPVGSDGKRVLSKMASGQYVVYFPVYGPSGVSVADGTSVTTNISVAEFVSCSAVGDFDPGMAEETVQELAVKAQTAFYPASLTTRSGAVNFVSRQFPNIIGASAVVSGDTEMLRDTTNPMGIREGKLDVFCRSKLSYVPGEQITTLTYDSELGGWVGRLSLPYVPAFFDLKRGVFRVSNFEGTQLVNTVYAKSLDENADNVGVSYSPKEALGILVQDTSAASTSAHSVSEIVNTTNSGASMTVMGEYAGSVFSSSTGRSVAVVFQRSETIDTVEHAVATVTDLATKESATIYFAPDNTTSPAYGQSVVSYDYDKLLKGLVLTVRNSGGNFVPSTLSGTRFTFSFKGTTAEFAVNFLHDPMLLPISDQITSSDNAPAGVDVLVRNPLAGYISQFNVKYRAPAGTSVDLAAARSQIHAYLSSIVYPNIYEESVIGTIMMSLGAVGVQSVVKRCTFFPSLASVWVDQDGAESTIPHPVSTTLNPPLNDYGLGARNIGYILDPNTIQFTPILF